MRDQIENVVIFGSGPAGLTAALYTARANMSPLVFEGIQPGGQLTITTDVDNYPGFPDGIMGPDLMENMKKQVQRFGARVEQDECTSLDLNVWPFRFKTTTDEGMARTIIIATGASARYLGLENEIRAPGPRRQRVRDLRRVLLPEPGGRRDRRRRLRRWRRRPSSRSSRRRSTCSCTDATSCARRRSCRTACSRTRRCRCTGTPSSSTCSAKEVVEGIRVVDVKTGVEQDMASVTGLFLAIGHTPNSKPFVEARSTTTTRATSRPSRARRTTNVPGVFACGDVQDQTYRQAVTAAGSGCMAALEAERWLEAKHHEMGH